MNTTPCKGCGKPMVWAIVVDENGKPTGKKVPLDPKPPVYSVGAEHTDGTYRASRNKSAMVSHFATCPKASQF